MHHYAAMRHTIAVTAALALLAGLPAQAAAWEPDIRAAKRYAAERPGVVSFAVRDGERLWGRNTWRSVPAASLMKTMLLAAYLRRGDVRFRPLRSDERAMLDPMIRRSDNVTATRVRNIVGVPGLMAIAKVAHMRDFVPYTVWGLSRTSARDQAELFLRIERILPKRHRRYAMGLLSRIVGEQRWGIGRARPAGWKLYFKGGWGSASGAVDHQAALLVREDRRVSLAITTTDNGSHTAGTETLEGVARRLLRGIE
jgi:beta-lactamase class A